MGFLEHLTPSDLTLLKPHESTLSCFLHPITGGIVDDLIITMLSPDDFYVVTNAGCADKDLAYIREHLAGYPRRSEVKHIVLAGQGLIAVQGPQANVVVQDFLQRAMGDDAVDLTQVYFGRSVVVDTPTYGELHIARGGYTGEDGFEISIPAENTEAVTKELLEIGKQGDILRMAGLGARDTLRLEAGMCLYGHDLDDSTTPIEAGLKWLVAKRRVMEKSASRPPPPAPPSPSPSYASAFHFPANRDRSRNFHGAETIARQYNDAKQIPRRRIGLTVEKGAPARESAEIIDPASGDVLGSVTSGCPSPTLGTNIAIGYVRSGFHKSGTELAVKVRGKTRKATVTKMPFVKTNYYRAP